MEALWLAWVCNKAISPHEIYINYCTVDIGGSLAVASRGLFATGVSTDLNGNWTTTG